MDPPHSSQLTPSLAILEEGADDALAPPSSSQAAPHTAESAGDLMRAKQEAQRRREALKLVPAAVAVDNSKVYVGALNPRGPGHLSDFKAARADLDARVSKLVDAFIGPDKDLGPWEPTAMENRLEVVVRSANEDPTPADHLAAEKEFKQWLDSVADEVKTKATGTLVMPDDLNIRFEALAGQGRLLAHRELFAMPRFASFGPAVYLTVYAGRILLDTEVLNAVTRTSNRQSNVTPFTALEVMAQVYATDVFDVAAESALKDAISEAALASAVKKMKTGLANPQLLATVKDLLKSSVLAQRAFNDCPGNFTMWRSQGATLVSIKLITAYRALLVGLESIMEVSGTLDHTTRPEFVNRVWRFFHTFTVPVVEKADGTYEFGCSSDEWATAVHLALAGPAKPSKKAKGDAAPGLPALAGDDAIIKAGFSVPAVYKQLKECDLSWFVLADSQGTLSFKLPAPHNLHHFFLVRHWLPAQTSFFRPFTKLIADQLNVELSFDMRSIGNGKTKYYYENAVSRITGFTAEMAQAVDTALFPLDPHLAYALAVHQTPKGVPVNPMNSTIWPKGSDAFSGKKLPAPFANPLEGNKVSAPTTAIVKAFGTLIQFKDFATLAFEPPPKPTKKKTSPRNEGDGAAASTGAAAGGAGEGSSASGGEGSGSSAGTDTGAGGTTAGVDRVLRERKAVSYTAGAAPKSSSPRKKGTKRVISPSEVQESGDELADAENGEEEAQEEDNEQPRGAGKGNRQVIPDDEEDDDLREPSTLGKNISNASPEAEMTDTEKARINERIHQDAVFAASPSPLRRAEAASNGRLNLGLAPAPRTILGYAPPAKFDSKHVPAGFRHLYEDGGPEVQEDLAALFGSELSDGDLAMMLTALRSHRAGEGAISIPTPSSPMGRLGEFFAHETPIGILFKELLLQVYKPEELRKIKPWEALRFSASGVDEEVMDDWRASDFLYPLVSRLCAATVRMLSLGDLKTEQQVIDSFSNTDVGRDAQWTDILSRFASELHWNKSNVKIKRFSEAAVRKRPHLHEFAYQHDLTVGAWRDEEGPVASFAEEGYPTRWRGQRRLSVGPVPENLGEIVVDDENDHTPASGNGPTPGQPEDEAEDVKPVIEVEGNNDDRAKSATLPPPPPTPSGKRAATPSGVDTRASKKAKGE